MFKFQYTLSHSEEVFEKIIYGLYYTHAENRFKEWLNKNHKDSVRSWKYI